MTTNYNTTFHMKGMVVQGGIDLLNGVLQNVDKIFMGDWSFEIDDENALVIKNDNVTRIRITNDKDLGILSNLRYERCFMVQPVNISECIGFFVSTTANLYNLDMTQTPSTNTQTLPTVGLSSRVEDSSMVGILVGYENHGRQVSIGNLESHHSQDDDVNRVFVHTGTGTGSVWVTDMNGSIRAGDYIITCGIPGYGMRQDDNIKRSHTGPKSMINCTFHPETVILKKPIDFDETGPVYTSITNLEGDPITDMEYMMKYVNIKGEQCTVADYTNDIERLCKGNRKTVEEALLSSKRKIFKACLIAYCY